MRHPEKSNPPRAAKQTGASKAQSASAGIARIQADVYAFVFGNHTFLASVRVLSELIDQHRASDTLRGRLCGGKGLSRVALLRVGDVEALSGTFVVQEGGA